MNPKEQHDALAKFATTCHEVLESNMHKGGWDQCSPGSLMQRVKEEIQEVENEMFLYGSDRFSLEALEKECADVANMVMMVYDRTRRMIDETQKLGIAQERFHMWDDPRLHDYWQRVYRAMQQVELEELEESRQ